jgi:hypothetical protein
MYSELRGLPGYRIFSVPTTTVLHKPGGLVSLLSQVLGQMHKDPGKQKQTLSCLHGVYITDDDDDDDDESVVGLSLRDREASWKE